VKYAYHQDPANAEHARLLGEGLPVVIVLVGHAQMLVDQPLKERLQLARCLQTLDVIVAREKDRQPRIRPEDFGGLHQSLRSSGCIWGEASEQVRRLHQIDVPVRRRLRQPRVSPDFRLIEQLSGLWRKQMQQVAEVDQRGDLRQLAQVALQIGKDVSFPPA
jgi:hypothetical protein